MSEKVNMKGKSLLALSDLSDEEVLCLIDLSSKLKEKKRSGVRDCLLAGKNIALVFEKSSTRTRCAAAVAAADEGCHAEYLASHDIHFGKKESVADTARVLGRMFDGIFFRGYEQSTVEIFAEKSGVPVWNGLTNESHPTQTLADLLTVKERFGRLQGLKLVYIGDGRNNVANSLMLGCAKTGVNYVNCTPSELSPGKDLVSMASDLASKNGSTISIERNPDSAVKGANIVYTDVWVSMGEEDKREERIRLLKPYQVTMDLMRGTGNMESGELIFLHCLPAFHDFNTEVTKETGAMEVTDEVFESEVSRVFDQAENRMHTIKALFVASML